MSESTLGYHTNATNAYNRSYIAYTIENDKNNIVIIIFGQQQKKEN